MQASPQRRRGRKVFAQYQTFFYNPKGKIFEQEQIARAIELGLGASGAEEIEVIAVNDEAGSLCAAIEEKLDAV